MADFDPTSAVAEGETPKLSKGVLSNGLLPGHEGNLDRSKAGDNWATFELSEGGIPKHYVLPTLPGDNNTPNDATGFMGDAVNRFLKDRKHYGAFDTDEAGEAFMKSPASTTGEEVQGFDPSSAKPVDSRIKKLGTSPDDRPWYEKLKDEVYVSPDKRESIGEATAGAFPGIPAEIAKQGSEAASNLYQDFAHPEELLGRDPLSSTIFGTAPRIAMDLLGYAASPITGALTSLAGRPGEALTGVKRELIGNTLAAAIPFGGEGAAAKAGATATRATPLTRAESAVADRLALDAKGGGPKAEDILDAHAQAPYKPLTLADLGGENVQALTGKLAREPGPARQTIRKILNDRDLAAGSRISGDVTEALGMDSTYKTAQMLEQGREKASVPLYKEAYEHPDNQNIASPVIDRILATPAGTAALKDARILMQNDRRLMSVPDVDARLQMIEAGQEVPPSGVATGFKMETLDYIKRAMDDGIAAAKKPNEKRILRNQKNDFVREIDNADATGKAGPNSLKPEGGAYKRARAAYSGPSQSLDALEEGKLIFKKDPEEVKADILQLNDNDREFYKIGSAGELRKAIAKTGASGDEARRIVGNQYVRDQLRPLFDSDQSYDKFIDSLLAEQKMFQTKNKLIGGSQTAERLGEDLSHPIEAAHHTAAALSHAASGNPLLAALSGLRARNALNRMNDPELNAEIAQILMSDLSGNNSPGMKLLRNFPGPATQNKLRQMQLPRFPAAPLLLPAPNRGPQ